jgi:arginyl-tRNA synthetase
MQYAFARVRSIFRRAELTDVSGRITLAEPAERLLGVRLLQLSETLETVAAECLPNLLCGYLFDLAGAFMGFYENCPVLKADGPVRNSRLMLADLTARAIHTGLGLLGIDTVERM